MWVAFKEKIYSLKHEQIRNHMSKNKNDLTNKAFYDINFS